MPKKMAAPLSIPSMARCPFCNSILPDEWLKSSAASLMGKARGLNKARTSEQAREVANARWSKWRKDHPLRTAVITRKTENEKLKIEQRCG
jgi:hypothetical protein